MTTMIRMTPEQYATRQAKLAGWIAPKAPKVRPDGRKVRKLDMGGPVSPKLPKARSVGEQALEYALKGAKAPAWVAAFQFCPGRRWRADFAFLEPRLLVEIEGGSFSQGRHVRGAGFEADCEKYAEAVIQGWRVLRVTTGMVKDGRALDMIMRALA